MCKALLVINRVTTAKLGAQHKYVNFTMSWSPDLGATCEFVERGVATILVYTRPSL